MSWYRLKPETRAKKARGSLGLSFQQYLPYSEPRAGAVVCYLVDASHDDRALTEQP